MSKKRNSQSAGVLCAFGILILSGCAGSIFPDIVSEDKKQGEAYSPAEVREMTIDHPATLSGEYFRNRTYPQKQNPEPEKHAYAGTPVQTSADNAAEKNAAKGDARTKRDFPVIYKIGLATGPGAENDLLTRHLSAAAAELSPESNLVIGPRELAGTVSLNDCRSEDVLECIGEQSALYPGVHMLVYAGPFSLPESFPGSGSLGFMVMDTGLGYVYSLPEISGSIKSRGDIGMFVRNAVEIILDFTIDKAGIMPAHCRVFSVKENRIYINAGKSGSISAGDQLYVISSGQVVDTPSGLPVAWVPDAPKATIKVEELIRDHVSACSLVRGPAPEPGDIVLIPGDR